MGSESKMEQRSVVTVRPVSLAGGKMGTLFFFFFSVLLVMVPRALGYKSRKSPKHKDVLK